jgi:hypothetical protein
MTRRGSRGVRVGLLFILTATWSVGGQRHALASLLPGKRPCTSCTRGWVDPRPVCTSTEDLYSTGIRSSDLPAWIPYDLSLHWNTWYVTNGFVCLSVTLGTCGRIIGYLYEGFRRFSSVFPVEAPRLGHNRFLPYPFQYCVHLCSWQHHKIILSDDPVYLSENCVVAIWVSASFLLTTAYYKYSLSFQFVHSRKQRGSWNIDRSGHKVNTALCSMSRNTWIDVCIF